MRREEAVICSGDARVETENSYSRQQMFHDPTHVAIFWIVFGAMSEIIALLPIKSNSWVQLILNAVRTLGSKKN